MSPMAMKLTVLQLQHATLNAVFIDGMLTVVLHGGGNVYFIRTPTVVIPEHLYLQTYFVKNYFLSFILYITSPTSFILYSYS